MLYTNLKHIESTAQHVEIINEQENSMVIWGRMEPKSILVYRIAEELEADYPNVKFYDVEIDNPGISDLRSLPELSNLSGIPYSVFYKNGQVVQATSGLQTKDQIVAILNNEFRNHSNI